MRTGWTKVGIRSMAFCIAALAVGGSAQAVDYYVRTDGNDANCTGRANASYPGSGTGQACAWSTMVKCAGTLSAGDRCLLQAGTYRQLSTVSPTRGGSLKTNNLRSDCTCTNESTSVTCGAAISGVNPGDFVQCDSGYGFSWSEVASVSGSTITLAEPYRGATSTNSGADTLDVAQFVQYIGQGATQRDVLISAWQPKPSGATDLWTKEPGTSCTYSYSLSDTRLAGTGWANPTSFHEATAYTEWDTWSEPTAGRDPYVRLGKGGCPCDASSGASMATTIDNVYRSWGTDAGKVYLHTADCADPDTKSVEAGDEPQAGAGSSYGLLSVTQPYTIVKNMAIEYPNRLGVGGENVGAPNFPYSYTWGVRASASNMLLEKVEVWTGRLYMPHPATGLVDFMLKDVKAMNGVNASPVSSASGLIIDGLETRLGHTSGWSVDNWSGASAEDRAWIKRLFLHRTGNFWSPGGSGQCQAFQYGYWDCSAKNWAGTQKWRGVHGLEISSFVSNTPVKHLTIENSIVEVTGDGFFIGGATNDVVFRNNTLGTSAGHGGCEVAWFGNTSGGWNIKMYNNALMCEQSGSFQTMVYYDGTNADAGITADYNAYIYPNNFSGGSAVQAIWKEYQGSGSTRTLDYVRATRGQEANGFLICRSGCSTANGSAVYNDGAGADPFVDSSVTDGDPSDYTPKSGARLVNSGSNAQCPKVDFYGRKRTDGRCDIGAVELQGGTSDTTPPSPVTGFTATAQTGQNDLRWTHSASSDAAGTEIRFRTDTFPTSRTDGSLACKKNGTPGSADSCLHTSLSSGTTYFYAAFAYDGVPNYSSSVTAQATQGGSGNTPPSDVTNLNRTDTK